MKTLFTVLGLIAAILAIILSVLPLSNIAYIPSIAALIFGLIAFYLAKQKQASKIVIQLVFLLTIIALSLATYKAIFSVSEVGDTQDFIEKEVQSKEDAIDELENLEIDELDIEE